ncbi:hypothetical protein ACU680_21880 [Pseudomonas koreensis]
MIAPWKFQCENLHIQFSAEVKPDSRASETLELLPVNVTPSQQMLLTISKMKSTCFADDDFMTSHEAILKVAVTLNSVQYYFPIFAIVDAPHSIVRGALLGYTKSIGKINISSRSHEFHWEGYENVVQFQTLESVSEDISLLPHLTYRNYRTAEFEAKGLSVLNISDYSATPISTCKTIKLDLPLLAEYGIRNTTPFKAGFVSDSFTVHGAQYA